MITVANAIRDERLKKNLSEGAVFAATGLKSFGKFLSIQADSPRTTADEVKMVLDVIKKMPKGERKPGGRPFKNPKVQAAVAAAQETGTSVAAVLESHRPQAVKKAPAAKKAPAKKTPTKATAKAAADVDAALDAATAKRAPAKKTGPVRSAGRAAKAPAKATTAAKRK